MVSKVFVFKYITQYMWFSVLANWANRSARVYCNPLKFIVITSSSVVVGGGSEPSCSWGGRWSQEQSSKINLEKFQSPLEASEFSTKHQFWPDRMTCIPLFLIYVPQKQLFSLWAKVFFYRIWLWYNKMFKRVCCRTLDWWISTSARCWVWTRARQLWSCWECV